MQNPHPFHCGRIVNSRKINGYEDGLCNGYVVLCFGPSLLWSVSQDSYNLGYWVNINLPNKSLCLSG